MLHLLRVRMHTFMMYALTFPPLYVYIQPPDLKQVVSIQDAPPSSTDEALTARALKVFTQLQ